MDTNIWDSVLSGAVAIWREPGSLAKLTEGLDLWQWLAEAYGDWRVILVLSSGILVVMLVFRWRLRRASRRLRAALLAQTKAVEATSRNGRDFSRTYEDLAVRFEQDPLLAPAWRDWRATHIAPDQRLGITAYQSTVRPSQYFSLALLRRCDIDPRFHAALPSMFVGVGLLLTFLGLALALHSAAGAIAAGDVATLETLLRAAGAKFVTSLVGLSCSLVYTRVRQHYLLEVERALDGLLASLEERIPLATSAGAQYAGNGMLSDLRAAQETFTNQLAVNLGAALDQAFNNRLDEHIGPLREVLESLRSGLAEQAAAVPQALDHAFNQRLDEHITPLRGAVDAMAAGISSQSTDAIRDLVVEFQEALRGSAGRELDGIAGQVQGLAHGLVGMRETLEAVARELGEAASQMRTGIATGASDVVEGLRREFEQFNADMRALAASSREEGSAAMHEAAERIAAAADRFALAAAEVSGALSDAAGSASTSLSAAVESMVVRLDELSENLTTRVDGAGASLAAQAETGATSLSGAADEAATTLLEAARQGATLIREGSREAAGAIQQGATKGGQSLSAGGLSAGASLQEAAAKVASPLQQLRDVVNAVEPVFREFHGGVAELRDTAAKAAAPLRAVADALAVTSAEVRKGLAEFNAVAAANRDAARSVEAAGQAARDAAQGMGGLANGLAQTATRFDGVDAEIGRVLEKLGIGVRDLSQETEKFLRKTNEEFGTATTRLGASITQLSDVLEEAVESIRGA